MSAKVEEIKGQDRWLVPSNSTPGVTYVVTRTEAGLMKCDCKAGQKGTFCRHKKGVSQHEENAAKAKAVELDEEVGQMMLGDFKAPAETEDKLEKESKTALGYAFGEVTSALQKEIRAGNAEAAVYWGLLLYGKSPGYVWKRLLIIAAEDIGFADQDAVFQALVINPVVLFLLRYVARFVSGSRCVKHFLVPRVVVVVNVKH